MPNVFSVQCFVFIISQKNIKTPYEMLSVLPILPESTPQQSIRPRIVFGARTINSQHLVDQIELFKIACAVGVTVRPTWVKHLVYLKIRMCNKVTKNSNN